MPDGTYAPQSPDLSSFFSASPPSSSKKLHPPQYQQQPQTHPPQLTGGQSAGSYAPRSPNLASLDQFSPTKQPQHYGFGGYQPPTTTSGLLPAYGSSPAQASFSTGAPEYSGRSEQSYLPPIPDLPLSHVEGLASPQQHQFQHQDPYAAPNPYGYPPQQQPQSPYDYGQPQQPHSQNFMLSPTSYEHSTDPYQNPNTSAMSASRAAGRPKQEPGSSIKSENGLGPSMGIDVRTKFPVARIKRIMQADEEVGKVAQVTPVAVSKALELFMISLVTKSSALARASNSKRVTAQHLKRAIEADVQFDFLGEIVAKVVEGPDAGGKRVKDDDSSGEEERGATKKKRGGGAGRGGRKKTGE